MRVTAVEFERLFATHANELLVEREGPIYRIAEKNGGACPNWKDGGCAVYDTRPRDCQLFPFAVFVRRRSDRAVSLGYHSYTRCPQKDKLLAPEGTAQELIRDLANEAFRGRAIEVSRETVFQRVRRRTPLLARSLLRSVRSRICAGHKASARGGSFGPFH